MRLLRILFECVSFLIIGLVFIVAAAWRVKYFDQTGKDIYAYERAVVDFIEGRNPYTWTIESYSNPDDPGNHGYAYLPVLLYIYWFLYICSMVFHVPYWILWKVPVLLADLGVGFLLWKVIGTKTLLNFVFLLVALLVWFFNPYFLMKANYVYTDPLPVFFMFLSLYLIDKDDVLAGAVFALSVGLKTFPILILPVMLLKSKNKFNFISAAAIVGFALSLPIVRSFTDLITYVKGALLIHEERFVQGRPILYYISYYYKIEFFRIISFKTYTLLSFLAGWVVLLVGYAKRLLTGKYLLSLVPFLSFYLFTPVLNRTYLIWFIPIFVLALYETFSKKYRPVYFVLLGVYFVFYYWYLTQWKDGFHIWHP